MNAIQTPEALVAAIREEDKWGDPLIKNTALIALVRERDAAIADLLFTLINKDSKEILALQTLCAKQREALQQMLDVAENADETGYVTDYGFVNIDDLHCDVREILSSTPAALTDELATKYKEIERLRAALKLVNSFKRYQQRENFITAALTKETK